MMTLGVLTTASEYGTGLIRTTMTACPDRGRVLMAKSIVFFALAFVVTLVATSLVALLQVSVLTDHGGREPTGGEWLKATVGISLYVALLGLLGLLAGSVIRHSAGAITLMIGVLLAPLVVAQVLFSESLRRVQQGLFTYSIPNQLSIFYDNSLSRSGPSGWDPLWIMLGLTAAVVVGAYALLEKRDECGPGAERRYAARLRIWARTGTAAHARCGGPAPASTPCASGGARPPRSGRARPPRAACRRG
jgi:ABC-type transport system involved in multi-copper enzyme maturation permease subunit